MSAAMLLWMHDPVHSYANLSAAHNNQVIIVMIIISIIRTIITIMIITIIISLHSSTCARCVLHKSFLARQACSELCRDV